jgi:single-strand DNA-binding protein
MASFNRVFLMGNLTRDPQLRYLPSNLAVCEFGVAMNRRFRDRDGNQREEVCFVDVTAWGRQAETINQYLSKGRGIFVEGRLKLDQWTGQDGQKRSKLTVVAENFQFIGGRGDAAGSGGGAPYSQADGPPGPTGSEFEGSGDAPPDPDNIPF